MQGLRVFDFIMIDLISIHGIDFTEKYFKDSLLEIVKYAV